METVFGLGILFSSVQLQSLKITLGILLGCFISHSACLDNYDFIIAGGGTGGLAVARRIAENGKHSVLVLESGGLPKYGMDIPAYLKEFYSDSDLTYQYKSTPQRNAGLRNNGVISIITGRMLSGTSNLNNMVWNRGHPKDYEAWGNITQDTSWNYSNMLKYFKRSETYKGEFTSDQHGFTGPVTTSSPRYAPGLEPWLAAGKYLGYPIADPNGPQQRSFTHKLWSKKFGRRDSSFTAYIEPIVSSTPKLHIILNTNVTQVIFQGKKAVGVRFHSESPELKNLPDNCLYANKEIIISAGAFGSPALLMRSGIGPSDVLNKANVPLVQELPVGQHYNDHVALPLHVIVNDKNMVMDYDRDLTAENWEYFNKFGDGPFSGTHGEFGQAFVVSSVAKSEGEGDWPDLHFLMAASPIAYFNTGLMSNSNNGSLLAWEAPMLNYVYLTRGKSRGSITLNPQEPNGLPILDAGYLNERSDIDRMLDGVKETIRIFEQTPTYRKLKARFPIVDIPQCRKFPFRTDEYWKCYIRYASFSGHHAAGTCRMGIKGDSKAVVDTRLRVFGVKRLRVVDASIMPLVTNCNTQAVVYGIAEKASDMILEDWQ